MTREEALLLVGGYATKTLTPAEREALFQAALEDQEVFDALQREQPLRELLDDPVSRQAILQALEKPRAAWFRSPWAWIPAAAVVAAGAVIALYPVRKANPPQPRLSAQVSVVSAPPLREPAKPEAQEMKQEPVRTRASAAGTAPAPLAAPKAIAEQPMAGVAGFASAGNDSMQRRTSAAFAASVLRENAAGEFEPLGTEPLRQGDRLRVEITSPVSGNVSLFRRGAAGERTLISTVPAAAGQKIQMPPDASIPVNDDATLEISIHPDSGAALSVVIPLRPQ